MNSTKLRIILALALIAAVHSNPIIVINNNIVNIGVGENGTLQHQLNENIISVLKALFEHQSVVIHETEEQVDDDDNEDYQEVVVKPEISYQEVVAKPEILKKDEPAKSEISKNDEPAKTETLKNDEPAKSEEVEAIKLQT